MSTFNWWRRNKKRKTLSKKKSLKQRLNHGDFELSQYYREAHIELREKELIEKEERKRGEELGLSEFSIKENIFNKADQYQRRYNRLMKDFHKDEYKILNNFRIALKKEYKKDLWESLYQDWLDGKIPDMDTEEFTDYYKVRSQY